MRISTSDCQCEACLFKLLQAAGWMWQRLFYCLLYLQQAHGGVLMIGEKNVEKNVKQFGDQLLLLLLLQLLLPQQHQKIEKEMGRRRRAPGKQKRSVSPFVVLKMRQMKKGGPLYDVKWISKQFNQCFSFDLIESTDYICAYKHSELEFFNKCFEVTWKHELELLTHIDWSCTKLTAEGWKLNASFWNFKWCLFHGSFVAKIKRSKPNSCLEYCFYLAPKQADLFIFSLS